jgi:ubiquinone/menaquinone biosynthesis C-methylase UbiE
VDRLLEATARAERDHFWFRGFRYFLEPVVARAAQAYRDVRMLDCGCGTGHNLTWLRRHGHAVGIDLTWRGLAFAHERGERAVAQATAAHLPFEDAAFHIVTSFDVIYALSDEVEAAALGEMCRVLKPGGALVLNVAAGEYLKGNHSLLAEEVRRYTKRTLGERLEATGFRIERMTYTNASILPALLGVRLVQRISGHQTSQEEMAIPSPPVNTLLTAALRAEAVALRAVNMPFGSSLLAVARKRA